MSIGQPIEVLSSSYSTEAISVCEFGKHSDVVAVLKRHSRGHGDLSPRTKGSDTVLCNVGIDRASFDLKRNWNA